MKTAQHIIFFTAFLAASVSRAQVTLETTATDRAALILTDPNYREDRAESSPLSTGQISTDTSGEEDMVRLALPAAPVPQIRFLAHGEDGLAARLAAIRTASKSIDLLTYIFRPCDSSSKILLDALVQRARNGVQVRLILDAYDISNHPEELNGLASYIKSINLELATPIDFRLYQHPDYGFLVFNPESVNNRTHIKMLLIDAQSPKAVAFIGGRNNSDGYFGLSAEMNYFDQDLMIADFSTAQKVKAAFETVLENAVFSSPLDSASGDSEAFSQSCLAKSPRDQAVESAIDEKAMSILTPAGLPIYRCSQIYFDMDDPKYRLANLGNAGPGGDDLNDSRLELKHSSALVLDFINNTNQVFNSVNQFYIPVGKLATAFASLRDSGKNVTVMANAIGDIDGGLNTRMTGLMADARSRDSINHMHVLGLSSLGGLHDDGSLRIEKAPWRIHTKTAVRDHRDVLVSSFNDDSRSYQINAEDALVVMNCPTLAHAIELEYQKMADISRADAQNCASCADEEKKNEAMLPLMPPANFIEVDFLF